MRLALAPARRPRIALTSLIDVVFLLLFFFMLASRSQDWRALPVDLATRRDGPPHQAAAPPPVVVLMADGRWMQRGEPIAREALMQQIDAARSRELVVVPARGASLQQLVDLIDWVQPRGLDVRLAHPGAAP